MPNANYLWINLFASALKPKGRAALVMANSASDARHSEQEIRKRLIEKGLISQMVTLPSNMFSTVTLPASLWFFDKAQEQKTAEEGDHKILFIDARNYYRQIDRAHREFTEEQIQNLATITRLFRGERERMTTLIHHYIEQIIERLQMPATLFIAAKEGIERVAKEVATIKPLPKEYELPNPQSLHDLAVEALEKSRHYALDVNPLAVETCHAKQIALGTTYAELLATVGAFRKKLEKAYRELEKTYKSLTTEQTKQLRLTPTTNLKNTRIILDQLAEAVSITKPLDAQWTEKSAFYLMYHLRWLQERFPNAQYEEVTGLCKAATLAEIAEQDYSLNSGRYVGVVIEEDGMTEEEFESKMKELTNQLIALNKNSKKIEKSIFSNLNLLFDE